MEKVKKRSGPWLEELLENNKINGYYAVRIFTTDINRVEMGASTVDRYPSQIAFQFFIIIMGEKGFWFKKEYLIPTFTFLPLLV